MTAAADSNPTAQTSPSPTGSAGAPASGPANHAPAPPSPQPQRRHGRDLRLDLPFSRSPVTLEDLLEGLLWPKLLRSAALALNPGRLWLSSFLIVAVTALDTTWQAAFGGREPGPLLSAIADLKKPAGALLTAVLPHVSNGAWTWSIDLGGAGRAILELFVTVPKGMIITPDGGLVSNIFATLILFPIGVLLTAVIGGALCRSVAVEFSTGRVITWTKALGFSISRWGSLVGALLGPVVIVWCICLVLFAAGWLMKWPVLNFLGGLLFPFLLLGALIASLVMAAYVLGHMMLLPAVACDGADGFDAVQRSYAYVYGHPLRLIAYLGLLLLQGAVAFLLLASFAWLALAVAEQTTQVPLDRTMPEGADWAERATRWLVGFWTALVRIATASYAISLYFAGSTLVYLCMRKLNDDQDLRDLWTPGTLEGTIPRSPAPASVPVPAGVGGGVGSPEQPKP